MLVQVDDEVLLGPELSHQVLGGYRCQGPLLAFCDLVTFHGRYFRNYSQTRLLSLRIAVAASPYCGNVMDIGSCPNRILNLNYAGVVWH